MDKKTAAHDRICLALKFLLSNRMESLERSWLLDYNAFVHHQVTQNLCSLYGCRTGTAQDVLSVIKSMSFTTWVSVHHTKIYHIPRDLGDKNISVLDGTESESTFEAYTKHVQNMGRKLYKNGDDNLFMITIRPCGDKIEMRFVPEESKTVELEERFERSEHQEHDADRTRRIRVQYTYPWCRMTRSSLAICICMQGRRSQVSVDPWSWNRYQHPTDHARSPGQRPNQSNGRLGRRRCRAQDQHAAHPAEHLHLPASNTRAESKSHR